MEIKAVYLLSEHSRLNTMKKIYRYLLLILLLSEICPLHSETIPADTLLMRLYERAASLMEKGELDQAQQTFDSAFAMPEAKQSPVYPILLNEQATLMSYVGKDDEAFNMKKVFFLICHKSKIWKNTSAYTMTLLSFIAGST